MCINNSKILKRFFDIIIASIGIVIFTIPIFVLVIIASFSTNSIGIFLQKRVGQYQKSFYIFKIRSMKINQDENTYTAIDDFRITKFGRFLRQNKLDELPQFFNVLIGNMSVVGPRPDVFEIINTLNEDEKQFLNFKPGLICAATLKFMDEELILSTKTNPTEFYISEIWPQKVNMNNEYVHNWSFINDIEITIQFLKLLFKSLFR